MTNTEIKLNLAVDKLGVNHPITLKISQKRDKEIVIEQRMLSDLTQKGFMDEMVKEFKSGNRV